MCIRDRPTVRFSCVRIFPCPFATSVNSLIARGMFNIDPHCYGLISEMRSYRHKSMFDGDEVTFLQKVEPNQSDHAIDAMRYAVLPLSSAQAAQSYGQEVGFHIG